jgi:urease accessory protein
MAYQIVKRVAPIAIGGLLSFVVTPVFAHPGDHHALSSFSTGFAHPLFGWDHVLAMLAIGLWAAQQRRPLVWLLPSLFPLVMAVGALVGLSGVALPLIETGIAGSVAVLGLLIAFAVRLPTWASASLVALFAMFHGYAHGLELPQGSSFGFYGVGFIAATALLHLIGLATGLIAQSRLIGNAVRVLGAGMAVTGVYLLAGTV